MIVRNCSKGIIKFLPDILIILESMMHRDRDLNIRIDNLVLIEDLLKLKEIHEALKPLS